MIKLNWRYIGNRICDIIFNDSEDNTTDIHAIGLNLLALEGQMTHRRGSDDADFPLLVVQKAKFTGDKPNKNPYVQELEWHLGLFEMRDDEDHDAAADFMDHMEFLANRFIYEDKCSLLEWTPEMKAESGLWPLECYTIDDEPFEPQADEKDSSRCLHSGVVVVYTKFSVQPTA